MTRRCLLLGLLLGPVAAAFGQLPPHPDTIAPTAAELALDAPAAPTGPKLFAEVDYLLWWVKPVCEPPATVSTGSPADRVPGAVGQPGTRVVLGSTRFEFPGSSGVRLAAGLWLDDDQTWGLMAGGTILPTVSNTRGFASNPAGPPAYLTYVSPTGTNEAIPFAVPGVVAGVATETGRTGLWGAEVSGIGQARLVTAPGWDARVGLLLGGRYQLLEDEVVLRQTQTRLVAPFGTAAGENRFATRNQFLGPQLGLRLSAEHGNWSVLFTQKLAVGVTRMECDVSGGPLVAGSPVLPGSLPGPLLALPSNVGRLTTERATLLPELNLAVRYRVTDRVGMSLGYNLLYWNRIFCPGDLMDKRVNLTQLPGFGPLTGQAFPTRFFARTDYFAQGLEAGLTSAY